MMNKAQTEGVDVREVDILDVLRSRFDGCDPEEGFAGGAFLHPADAKMVHDALAELIEKGVAYRKAEIACSEDHVGYRRLFDALQVARAEFGTALARVGGAK